MLYSVIDRSLDCLSWDISFFVEFVSSDFSTTDTTRDTDFDTFCTFFHGFDDSLFDDTTIRKTTLNLTTDTITYERSMNIWIFDFFDVDIYLFCIQCCEFLLEFFEIFTIFSEDKSCTRCIDNNTETGITVSDSDMTYWETLEKLANEITDDNILLNSECVFCFVIVPC